MKFIDIEKIDPNRAWINPQNNHKIDYKLGNNITCTAGINYLIAKHDGKIYKCFHDNYILGDILEYPKCLLKQVEVCQVGYVCDSSGDQMFTTQWGNKENTKNNIYKDNPVCTHWVEPLDPQNVIKDNNCVIITPTYACNYRCSYCCNYYPDGGETRNINRNIERSLNDWIKFLDSLRKHLNHIQIIWIGGEPLMYPHISELIKYAYNLGAYSSIVSNCSSEKQLKNISNIDFKNPNMFEISCSLHPNNKIFDLDLVLQFLLYFKRKKHRVRASVVSYPTNLPYYKQWKELFKLLKIPLWLKGCGGYNEDPGFTPEVMDYLYHEGSHKSTPEYLQSIGWV